MTQLLSRLFGPLFSTLLFVSLAAPAFADVPPPVKLNSRQVKKLESYGSFFGEKMQVNEEGLAFSQTRIDITCTGEVSTDEGGDLTMKNRRCEIGR